ncbi:hypothetical protein [Methanobacterium sp.]|uniref:hypothetical protein n=1 Tax=Methanobacterium sp. TaxID=2164 RepID=UPI003C757C9B
MKRIMPLLILVLLPVLFISGCIQSESNTNETPVFNQTLKYSYSFNNYEIYMKYPSNWNSKSEGLDSIFLDSNKPDFIGLTSEDITANYNKNIVAAIAMSSAEDFEFDYNYTPTDVSQLAREDKKEAQKNGGKLLSEKNRKLNGIPAVELTFQFNNITEKHVWLLIEFNNTAEIGGAIFMTPSHDFDSQRETFENMIKTIRITEINV